MVLPPKEGFSAGRVGAIGTVVHHLATSAGDALLPPLLAQVVGPPLQVPPFPDVPYHVAAPSWWPPFADNLRYAQGVVRLLRRLRPAMIEVHNRPQVARSIAAACHPTPVVLVLHNDPQTMPGAREPAQRGRLLHRFARIVCVSDYIRRRWMDGVAPQDQAAPLVMINPINFTDLPAPPATRNNLILFVGRVVPEKGTDIFVTACAAALPQLPGWRAEVIGADRFRPDSPDTDFTNQVRQRAGPVVLRGYQPHAAVLEAMSRASIVVIPSRWQDPCPLTALEAMACGAALITTRRGGLPEIGGDAAVYFDPDSPDALVHALLDLGRDRERLDAVQRACRERVRQFDLPGTAARWNAMRRDVLAGRPC